MNVTSFATPLLSVKETVEPEPAWSAVYEDGYARFRMLYPTLRTLEGA